MTRVVLQSTARTLEGVIEMNGAQAPIGEAASNLSMQSMPFRLHTEPTGSDRAPAAPPAVLLPDSPDSSCSGSGAITPTLPWIAADSAAGTSDLHSTEAGRRLSMVDRGSVFSPVILARQSCIDERVEADPIVED